MGSNSLMTVLAPVALWAALGGCSAQPTEPLVAQVGGQTITAADFRDFDALLPAGMKQAETPAAAKRQVLESLIDKTLLLLEVADADIAADPKFKKELARYERGRLQDLYFEREVAAKIVITPEEMERHYHDSGRDRALRLGGIMVESLEEAQGLIARLGDGADFFALAKEHSVHRKSGERGGDTGVYQTRDQLSDETARRVMGLAIDEISEPVPEAFAHGEFYVVYKLLDEIPAPLSASEKIIAEELTQRKRAERVQALGDSLRSVYAPRVRGEAVRQLAEDPDSGEEGRVLCTYGDETLTVGQFLVRLENLSGRKLGAADSALVARLLHEKVLPDLFFAAEIEEAGLRRDAAFLADLERKSEELKLDVLRWREVDRHVSVSEDEAREFYERHPEKFTAPETTVITEILVTSDTLAQRLADQLRAGGDPEALADRHTLREGAKHHGGKLNLNIYTQSFFPDVYRAAQGIEPGGVGGPLKTAEGYSVFKVEERSRDLSPYHDESKRRAQAYVRIDKAKRGYVAFVRGLRQKYPVRIHEEGVQKL